MSDAIPPAVDLDDWWRRLCAAALVGTARRDVPDLPDLDGLVVAPRAGATREQRLLDAAALGDAVRRGGRRPIGAPEAGAPAARETRACATPAAVQVLGLLLVQGPVAAAARDALIRHWFEVAASSDRVLDHATLPAALDLGTRVASLRPPLVAVLGARGRWLAAQNPDWRWVLDQDDRDGSGPTAIAPLDRAAAVANVRRDDPRAGRELVLSTWGTDTARDRAAGLLGLRVGLGADDEELLERSLDDRAKGVREQAADLLDRLPGSARAGRMAQRLRDLVSVRGTLRRSITVALPGDPDPEAVRDGLVEPGAGVSRRARWRAQIVVGAPLTVWTDLVGGDPGRVVTLVLRGADQDGAELLTSLGHAAVASGDVTWARALLPHHPDTRLAALLPAVERERAVADRVHRQALGTLTTELAQTPAPWGPGLSAAVVTAIRREKSPGHAVRVLRDTLAVALDPSVGPDVERLMDACGDDTAMRTALRDVLQYQSLHRSISEAFR